MTDLSPQAQAVLDAFNGYHEMVNRRVKIAAALRALVMEVVISKYQYADWEMAHIIQEEIQAIADELENV